MLAVWFGLIHIFRSNNCINCNNPLLSLNFSSYAVDKYIILCTVMFGFSFIVQNGTELQSVLVIMISHLRKLFHSYHVGTKYIWSQQLVCVWKILMIRLDSTFVYQFACSCHFTFAFKVQLQ